MNAAREARRHADRLQDLPRPGAGSTLARWQSLAEIARHDLSVARLVEGHVDALAICAELGRPAPGGFLGVWAARPAELRATRHGDRWCLTGSKPFCSGAGLVDAALVTATAEDGVRLFAVDAHLASETEETSWSPLGMGPTASTTRLWEGAFVDADAAVGGPNSYVDRPGFGHGGCGVAACWWGGASALLDELRARTAGPGAGDLTAAALGRAVVALHGARSVLRDAAESIDRQPGDRDMADHLALVTRAVVAEACRVVLDVAMRHLGTTSLATAGRPTTLVSDLTMYLTQHRDESLILLGRAATSDGSLC